MVGSAPSTESRVMWLLRRLTSPLKQTRDHNAPTPHLPDEVVRRICLMSQVPLHIRSGSEFYSADRSNLIQSTLAALARVCRRYNAIAEPILYLEIITDNPIFLLRGALKGKNGFPPGASRKLRLLACCRHLHIEPDKVMTQGIKPGHSHSYASESSKARKVMNRLEEAFEALHALGGFAVIFPNLETFTVSAYTGALLHAEAVIWSPNHASMGVEKAWRELLSTVGAPIRCHSTARSYPFHGAQVDRLNGNFIREPRRAIGALPQHVQYFHARDLDYSTWTTFNNIKVVYLYNPDPSIRPQLPEMETLKIAKRVTHVLSCARSYVRRENDGLYRGLDIEFRIPRSCFDLSQIDDGFKQHMLEEELGKVNRLVLGWYRDERWDRLNGDKLVLKVLERPIVCPACQPPAEGLSGESHHLDIEMDLLGEVDELDAEEEADWELWRQLASNW